MRALFNDNVEGLPPRLNTSSDISNESIIYQPRLLKTLPTWLEKRERNDTDIPIFILSNRDTSFP